MTNETDQIDSNQAQKVLYSIQEMTRAGLRRAIPPLWFGATIALLTGVLFTFAGLGISRLYMAPLFLLMVFTVMYQTHKTGVIMKPLLSKRIIFMMLICILAILIPLILVIREHLDVFGPWAALSLGIVITIAVFALCVFERRLYLTKINTEKSE